MSYRGVRLSKMQALQIFSHDAVIHIMFDNGD